jgi:hypothetical protein
MKKIFNLSILLIGLFVLAAPIGPGFAQDSAPIPETTDDWVSVFLPLVSGGGTASFTVSGQIMDAREAPLSGVTVTAGNGALAVTDESGVYSLTVPAGLQDFEAAKEGYNLDPAVAQLDVDHDIANLHFTAIQQCTNPIPNSSFEILYFYWNPISGNAAGYTPYYSALQANTGLYSGFTGIMPSYPAPDNVESWSRFRTHEITIPYASTSADLYFSFWPQTTETAIPDPVESLEVGFDTEALDAPSFPYDFYYVAVIDENNEIVDWIFTDLANDQAWTSYGPIDLLQPHLIGQTFRLEIGTYNQGTGGVTSAFIDDIELDICPSAPPSTGCYNLLLNSTFETGTDWVIKPATLPSAYSTEFWYSPSTSMRSGVPSGFPNPFPAQWTTSEFYQPVTVPANAYHALLKTRLLPRSSEPGGYISTENESAGESYGEIALASEETQYGYIMDPTGTITHKLLFKYYYYDSAYWLYREFDLIGDLKALDLLGVPISVLFGAANDGWNGDTGLWVDETYLEICQ